ncbi:MAG: ABC transporter permease subunit [Thermoanaerobacteraceae bacterium]|nr:ABC transporter permease subunit [Thermoanaerobacteraceae bacterium]
MFIATKLTPAIRLTNLGIRQVPQDIIEAAGAFGSTSRQLVTKVQLPMALPTVILCRGYGQRGKNRFNIII